MAIRCQSGSGANFWPVLADIPVMAKSESRFGFGQLSASLGVGLLGLSLSQPWLKLDISKAFSAALSDKSLDQTSAGRILFTSTSGPLDSIKDSPQVQKLATDLGIGATGWDQNHYAAGVVLGAALLALIGVVRSVFASTAGEARSNAPLLATAGLAALIASAVTFWLLAPEPRTAMRPDLGMWLMIAGGVFLLMGALTLGNNRRRPWIDDLDSQAPPVQFEHTEHLAYSHGAWVPRVPDHKR